MRKRIDSGDLPDVSSKPEFIRLDHESTIQFHIAWKITVFRHDTYEYLNIFIWHLRYSSVWIRISIRHTRFVENITLFFQAGHGKLYLQCIDVFQSQWKIMVLHIRKRRGGHGPLLAVERRAHPCICIDSLLVMLSNSPWLEYADSTETHVTGGKAVEAAEWRDKTDSALRVTWDEWVWTFRGWIRIKYSGSLNLCRLIEGGAMISCWKGRGGFCCDRIRIVGCRLGTEREAITSEFVMVKLIRRIQEEV